MLPVGIVIGYPRGLKESTQALHLRNHLHIIPPPPTPPLIKVPCSLILYDKGSPVVLPPHDPIQTGHPLHPMSEGPRYLLLPRHKLIFLREPRPKELLM